MRRRPSTTNEVASLYDLGWRQGSLVDAELSLRGLVLGDGGLVVRSATHPAWVVASQDCDLAGWQEAGAEPLVELRARRPVAPNTDWGIRSRTLRLNPTEGVVADDPPVRISPQALLAVVSQRRAPPAITSERAVALKTWLGRRYDRPAVPEHLVELARDIARRARRPSQRPLAPELHDVLMQFDDNTSPPRYALFAVVSDGGDKNAARSWLTAIAMAVPPTLGALASVDAGYRSETSLELIESSYSADVSQLSWPGPSPEGAV